MRFGRASALMEAVGAGSGGVNATADFSFQPVSKKPIGTAVHVDSRMTKFGKGATSQNTIVRSLDWILAPTFPTSERFLNTPGGRRFHAGAETAIMSKHGMNIGRRSANHVQRRRRRGLLTQRIGPLSGDEGRHAEEANSAVPAESLLLQPLLVLRLPAAASGRPT